MNDTPIITVLGLYPGSLELPPQGEGLLAAADLLVGGKRLLDEVPYDLFPDAERLPVTAPLSDVMDEIRQAMADNRAVVVLADGDPLFFGLGRNLVSEFGPEALRIFPSVTTVQLAASRLGVPWEDMGFLSLHGRADYTPLFSALVRKDWVAVFTDAENTPDEIARVMLQRGIDCFTMTVLENLGAPEELVRSFRLEETWGEEFAPLNLVVLERTTPPEIPVRVGIPDHYFLHQRGLITKQPVRAMGLSMLSVRVSDTVWDLGAGCGSVSIEASYLAAKGCVYAVERDRTRASMIGENVRRCGAWSVEVVHGDMPDCLEKLPDPDRIFIGGGLGGEANRDKGVLEAACKRLKPGGRLVAHCILLDSLQQMHRYFKKLGWPYGISQLSVNNADTLADDLRLKAGNPVFIVWAERRTRQ